MKDFNLLTDPDSAPEKSSRDADQELTTDNFDELVQMRSDVEESEDTFASGEGEAPAPEPTEETNDDDTVLMDEPTESDFDSSINKKRLFLILGIVVGLIVGGVVLFMILSSSEEPPTAMETPQVTEEPAQPEAAQQPETPAINPALVQQFARNQAYNGAVVRMAGGVFSLKAGNAAPVMIVTEGNNLLITVKANSLDDAARFRMAFKGKFPNLEISSMGKSVSRSGESGYWDLVVPITAGAASTSGVDATALVSPAAFQSELQQLLRQNGLQVVKLQKGPVIQNVPGGKAHIFYLEMRGDINRIMAFLNQLTSDFPAAKFHKVRIGYPNFKVGASRAEAEVDVYLMTE